MAQPVIQHSFHAGEWAPALNARVDMAKYHAGAALMRNFFVDYRGGASSCPGTKYILQGYQPNTQIRLIPFAASFTVNYVLEFGQNYIRFYNNGGPVLENGLAITAITNANPGVLTVTAHGYNTSGTGLRDWVFITGVGGMTQLNGKYYQVISTGPNTIELVDLAGNIIDTTSFGTYISGGTTSRVYTISSPYLGRHLSLIKFAQNVNFMVLCHPVFPPYVLRLDAATHWSLTAATFGTTVGTPTISGVTTSQGGSALNFSYVVTAIDVTGQESGPSSPSGVATANQVVTNTVTISAVSGALSYNCYKATVSEAGAVPVGAQYGFVGSFTGTQFIDTNISPDFSLTPPIVAIPPTGAPVSSLTVTGNGTTYASVPSLFIAAPPAGNIATGHISLGAYQVPVVHSSTSFSDTIGVVYTGTNGTAFIVTAISGGSAPTAFAVSNPGSVTGAGTAVPSNPQTISRVQGQFTFTASVDINWNVQAAILDYGGTGYLSAPAVTLVGGSPGVAGTVTSSLSGGSGGTGALVVPSTPAVPTFFQQRLVLANNPNQVQTFWMSQPGSYFNFNISDPLQPDDAIQGTIASTVLNSIKSLVPMSQGLIILGDRGAWLVNGGAAGAPVAATQIVANPQAYNGASDVPPIVVNYDLLYVQAKNSIVRDATFDFYKQIYTGTDVSVLSSHLFYGFQILEWAYSEEPFKLVWAVRDDGTLLSLTFLKEQEIIGWSHRDTQGKFKSIASIVETVTLSNGEQMNVDAVYTVVQRTVNSVTTQYIERMAERIFPNGVNDAWFVDAGLKYSGSPATVFSGLDHLVGATVTGLADGAIITPTVVSAGGSVTLPSPASVVTIGLGYTPQLQTLALDLGEPTVQGKRKKITAVTVRCQETLGLSIGSSFGTLVPMKDLIIGNVGSATNTIVSGLVTADARTVLDPTYTVPGQYCMQQNGPLPVTVLGVIPEVVVGDTPK